MFSFAAAMLRVYIAQCNRNEITRILPCLLTAGTKSTKITQKHTPSINQLHKTSSTTKVSVPTTWCRDHRYGRIMTSPHPMYKYNYDKYLFLTLPSGEQPCFVGSRVPDSAFLDFNL